MFDPTQMLINSIKLFNMENFLNYTRLFGASLNVQEPWIVKYLSINIWMQYCSLNVINDNM